MIESKKLVALYLGRFQPCHDGHLNVIKGLSDTYKTVIIAICSAQCEGTKRNPYSYYDRHRMMTLALKEFSIDNYKIIPIPDIKHPSKWAEYCHAIFGKYDVVITNNPNTKKLFEGRGDRVEGFTITIDREFVPITGTRIREHIHNPSYVKELVPFTTWLYLYTSCISH